MKDAETVFRRRLKQYHTEFKRKFGGADSFETIEEYRTARRNYVRHRFHYGRPKPRNRI